jgi:enoyl-[acyl-carrier-protein] reductase (NADH)
MENMALELGPAGVTVACLRTTANVDSRSIQDTFSALASRMNLSKDANAAVLLASDLGRMMTGTVVNCTAGAAAD